MKNRCSSDCHCDGERHCSSSKFCAGISRPNKPATITPISETEPKEIVSEMIGGKTFETSTNTPLAIHRPKFMSWIKEPLCTPILQRYPWEKSEFIYNDKEYDLNLAGIAAGAGNVFMLMKNNVIKDEGYRVIKQSNTTKTKWNLTNIGGIHMDVD